MVSWVNGVHERAATMSTLKIFVSSPGDVGLERRIALRVIERLQGELGKSLTLEPVLWEQEPMRATAHFQAQIIPPSETDIVVTILWSRLGTRLPTEDFRRDDGSAYESGTEWEFEDAVNGYKERGFPDILVFHKKRSRDIGLDVSDDELNDLRAQWQKVQAFVNRWFRHPEGTFKAAFTSFSQVDEFESRLESHLRKLIRERRPEVFTDDDTGRAIIWHKGSPFRGLQVFDLEHADVFFGRTRAIADLRDRLTEQAAAGKAFVLLFGTSGSGKSSLVRAGLLPTLTQPGVVEGIGLWRWAIFQPATTTDVIAGLANTLQDRALPDLQELGFDADELAALWRDAPERGVAPIRVALDKAVERWAAMERVPSAPAARLLLVVDQMEELFTREDLSDEQRAAFVRVLSALARSGAVWIVGTMRSDFYSSCTDLPELVELKEGAGQYDLAPPNAAELGQMIRYPARAAGLRFEVNARTGERLDDRLQEAAAKDPESLPLLEFTLEELFKQRKGNVLTFEAYDALGGLEGAIAQRAESVFGDLTPESRAELPALLHALVTISSDGTPTARQASVEALTHDPARKKLVDSFVTERLLATSHNADGQAVVRVAHEALLAHWPRARKQIEEDRGFLATRARIESDVAVWVEKGREPGFLIPSGRRLAEAADLLSNYRGDLKDETVSYIEASVDAELETRRRVTRRWQVAFGAMFVLAIVAVAGGLFALRQKSRATSNFGIALDATDKLAVDIATEIGTNYTMRAENKLWLAEQLDVSFGELVAGVAGSRGLEAKYADLMASLALMLFDAGRNDRAIRSARQADALLFPDGRPDVPAPPVIRARVKLALVRAHQAELSLGKALGALDQADEYFEATVETAVDRSQMLPLAAMLARARTELLGAARRPEEASRVETETREAIMASLAEMGSESLDRVVRRRVFSELLKLQAARASLQHLLQSEEKSAFTAQYREMLDEARPFFKDGNDPEWLHFEAYGYMLEADAHDDNERRPESFEAIKIAIDRLRILVHDDYDNLLWRYHLGQALIDRADYSITAGDFLQAKADLDVARALNISLLRDSANPSLSITLGARQNFYEGRLYSAEGREKRREQRRSETEAKERKAVEAFSRLVARTELRRRDAPDWLSLNDNAYFGHYGMHQAYAATDSEKSVESLEKSLAALNNNEGAGLYLASRRYYVNSQLLGLGADSDAETRKRRFTTALEDAEMMIAAYPDSVTWLANKKYVVGTRAIQLANNGNHEEALALLDQAIETGMASLERDPGGFANVSDIILFAGKKLTVQAAMGDWDGMAQSAALAREVVPKSSDDARSVDSLGPRWRWYRRTLVDTLAEIRANGESGAAMAAAEILEEEVALAEEMTGHVAELAASATSQSRATPDDYRTVDFRQFDLSHLYLKDKHQIMGISQSLSWASRPLFPASWRTLIGDERDRAMAVFGRSGQFPDEAALERIRRVRRTELNFYDDGFLLDAEYADNSGTLVAKSVLVVNGKPYFLNGTSPPIHIANSEGPIKLSTAAQADSYFRFFHAYVAQEAGNFQFVESKEDFDWSPDTSMETKEAVERLLRPLVVWRGKEKDWPWRATGTVQYSNALFYADLRVSSSGLVEMLEDSPVAANLPASPPRFSSGARIVERVEVLDLRSLGEEPVFDEEDALLELSRLPEDERPGHYLALAELAVALKQAVDAAGGSTFGETLKTLNEVVELYVDAGQPESAQRFQDAMAERWYSHLQSYEVGKAPYSSLSEELGEDLIYYGCNSIIRGDGRKTLSEWEVYASDPVVAIVLAHVYIALDRPEEALAIYRANSKTGHGEDWLAGAKQVLARMEADGDYVDEIEAFHELLEAESEPSSSS